MERITIKRNPAPMEQGFVKLGPMKFHGQTILPIIGALVFDILVVIAMKEPWGIVPSLIFGTFPLVLSLFYIKFFIKNKPKNYATYFVLDKMGGGNIRIKKKGGKL